MKKIYQYYLLFFMGLLLPFLLVEFYFQEYFSIGIIAIIASVVLTFCIFFEYLKVKFKNWFEVRNKGIDYLYWAQRKENSGRVSSYFFRKNLW